MIDVIGPQIVDFDDERRSEQLNLLNQTYWHMKSHDGKPRIDHLLRIGMKIRRYI